MANLRRDKPDARGAVATGADRLSLQKRSKYLFYVNTTHLPYHYDINCNGDESEGIYKIRKLGTNCFINAPVRILCLDYP